jgi:hypothetical protein
MNLRMRGPLASTLSLLRLRSLCGLAAFLFLAASTATAAPDAALSAKAIAWANAHIADFNQAASFAHNQQPKPPVPVPPKVDPPCHVCGDNTQTQGEAEVAAWVAQTQQPELTYIKTILDDAQYVEKLGGASSGLLTPAAVDALSHFDYEDQALRDAGVIARELVENKAGPMTQQYGEDPKRAFAGISFLIAANQGLGRLGADSGSTNQQQLDNYALEWEQALVTKTNTDVLSGHQYNLCPVYAAMVKELTALGGAEPADLDKFQDLLKKLQNEVKFNVNLDLHVSDDHSDGGYIHAEWKGQAKLTLTLDFDNSCYTPTFENGGAMSVGVANWDMIGIDTENGRKVPVPVTLESSHQYNAQLGTPQLDLCDPQPIFQMPSPSSYPQEIVSANNQTQQQQLFGPYLGAVIAANEIDSRRTDAATGQKPTLPSGSKDTAGASPSGGSGSSDANPAMFEILAHKGDPNWLMSPEGQAAIAAAQKQAIKIAQAKAASKGLVVPDASNFDQFAQSIQSAHLPWTNGMSQPVNKTLHVKKGTADITLTVSVNQAAN